MKFPKNRDTVFMVYRQDITKGKEIPIAVFRNLPSADEFAGKCLQEMLDKGATEFRFGVGGVVYYDE